jgi:cytochrome c-type biogenesis protein CcmE
MKRKTQRLMFVTMGLVILGIAAGLVLFAVGDNLRFFMSPSELQAAEEKPTGPFRMGGLVIDGSLSREVDMRVRFAITDGVADIAVQYDQQAHGLLPDLFREGQGVVVEGRLGNDGAFVADRVLAKHDETYMPKEVADALKRSGHWEEQYGDEKYGEPPKNTPDSPK